MDIWGPYTTPSVHHHRYFFTVVDDYSRPTWAVMLKSKSEVQYCIKKFILMIENQFNTNVKQTRSDNGPEFNLSEFYSTNGIMH